MEHRHLNHCRYTLSAIDGVITRGKKADWLDLMGAAQIDAVLLEKIERICRANANAEFDADLYEFWRQWAEKHRQVPPLTVRNFGDE